MAIIHRRILATQSSSCRHAMTKPTKTMTTTLRLPALTLQLLAYLIAFGCITIPLMSAKSLSDSGEIGGAGGGGEIDAALSPSSSLYHHHGFAQHQHQHQAVSSHHRRRLQRRNSDNNEHGGLKNNAAECSSIQDYFESIDIKVDGIYAEKKGPICDGHCCTNSTEMQLQHSAKNKFVRLLQDHTGSLRGILETTANVFQKHVLELAEQSENKTLNVFSQVYRRMVPLSRKLIHELYAEIISHLRDPNANGNTIQSLNSLEEALHKFFVNLFPVAYHQAVHLSKDNYGELHEDYINCLKHTFDELQPFGTIPKDIKRNLLQSVQTAVIFINTLMQSAEVLGETMELYDSYLTATCQKQLLKMNYCSSCNGWLRKDIKPCHSYCMNVLRGCSAQYAGVLDSPWSNVVDAIENLVTTHIRSDSGIVATIKQLDVKLSETIMRAMENGPELEQKVKKTCGTPKLLPSLAVEEIRPMPQHTSKWAISRDADITHFLATLHKSKDFYSNIVDNTCRDDVEQNDHNCWTGERIGEYTQLVMTAGADTQRYNPEVPLETHTQSTKLNELMDKLIKIRKNVGTAIPTVTRVHSDIQSDMARRDEEGSGRMIDDIDDEEFEMQSSGDGSGNDGDTTPPLTDGAEKPYITTNNEIEHGNSTAPPGRPPMHITNSMCILSTITTTLVTIVLRRNS